MTPAFLLCLFIGFIDAIQTARQPSLEDTTLWGPYRPNLYMGIRPRLPESVLMGLMWANANDPSNIAKNLRHTCEQDEGMQGYGWSAYDARHGGEQIINDVEAKVDLTMHFVKLRGKEGEQNWGLSVAGELRSDAPSDLKTTVVFYIGLEAEGSTLKYFKEHPDASVFSGLVEGLPSFRVRIPGHQSNGQIHSTTAIGSLKVEPDSIWKAKSIFINELKKQSPYTGMIESNPGEGNLQFIQKTLTGSFEFNVLFSELTSDSPTINTLTIGTHETLLNFERRYRFVYKPRPPFHDERHASFGQSLVSNLMGGIGYFYGTSKVDVSDASEYAETSADFWTAAATAHSNAEINSMGPYELLSSVPSRPFFPRGFLWDEGFHLLVTLEWDIDLALEIISSWFNLMDDDGWIAREQILGSEARTKVPKEFQIQYPHHANPPTMFLAMKAIVDRLTGRIPYTGVRSHYLDNHSAGKVLMSDIYSKMKKHYDWFRHTQAGELKNYQKSKTAYTEGYRWRGRTPQHTLTSGLDDYPRAQPPHPEELHIDALSWVGAMATALKQMATALGYDSDQAVFSTHELNIRQSIQDLHWSDSHQAYCDTTISSSGRIEKVCHKGYVSLFPFLLGFVGPEHDHLKAILDLMHDPDELWSSFGMRSLSAKDEYYGTDENYWRSPIWININYLAVAKLLEISEEPGPYRQKAKDMYIELRQNLVNTVYTSWSETGFAWEQYNPNTGKGQRTQHFTGWTALVVKIMAMPDLGAHDPPVPVSTSSPVSKPSSIVRPGPEKEHSSSSESGHLPPQPHKAPQMDGVPIQNSTDGWDTSVFLSAAFLLAVCLVYWRRIARLWRGFIQT